MIIYLERYGCVEPKIGGYRWILPPKWMVYNNGSKPDFVMDDLGVPLFWKTPIYCHMKVTYYFNKYDMLYNIDIFDRTSAYHIGKSAPFFHGFLIDVKKNIAGR